MTKPLLSLLLTICVSITFFAQDREEILAEGWLLYNSERASWHGTDIFLAKYPEKRDAIGGYFSYTEDKTHKCIFFDKQEDPLVLAAITFDSSFVVEVADINTTSRKLNSKEKELFIIREKAIDESIKDTLFKRYENTSLNFVPLIVNNKKKVYALTGPSVSGVVVFGNDYLITFDKKDNIISKKELHKNIIPIDYTSNSIEKVTTMHSHTEETGNLITATDICTLLLYGPHTNWKQHMVISKENVSIWDCGKEELIIMTRKAWENISNGTKQE